eukprot:6647835-Pyramimonas_sp.AAC.2
MGSCTSATPRSRGFHSPRYRAERGRAVGERMGKRTQGEERGRVSGVLRVPLPLLPQENP